MYLMLALAFVFGACIGSFLNVCIYRLPLGQSVVFEPSHCTGCGRRLGVRDLVPLISYLLLKGRCRYCAALISARYPLVELLTALLFVAAYQFWGWQWQTAAYCMFFAVLVTAAFIDYRHSIIPDELIIAGCVLGLPLLFLSGPGQLVDGLIGFLVAGLLFLLIAVVSRGGLGGGDIKLAALMGLYLGFPDIFIALFSAFLLGALVSIVMLALGKKSLKDAVPFGPFLALGGVTAAFGADPMISWYLRLVGL